MAVDMFLKIEGEEVKGGAKDHTHKGEIDVLAWSWGASNSGSFHTGGGGGAGKANFQDLSVTKYIDRASTALMLACNAEFRVRGPNGERTITASDFFLGTFWTALEADEVMTEIVIPAFKPKAGYAYCKLKRKQGDWATAASAVVLRLEGDTCAEARIGLTNVGPMALNATDAAAVLVGKVIDEAAIDESAEKAMAICDPAEDLRGDVEYKTHMAGEMTRRAIRQALERAKGN